MPFRPFPQKSSLASQEFDGGHIDTPLEGYLVAYIDGGSRGNPGPSGYGVVLKDEGGRPVAELSEFLGRQTNNYAEYSALLATLNYALQNTFKALKVTSDSELLVKQIKGEYKVGNPALKELHGRAMKMLGPSREEADCLSIHAFRSIRDPGLFYIHSRWTNEAAFDHHSTLPHTVRFVERVEPLIDHAFDVTRAELLR